MGNKNFKQGLAAGLVVVVLLVGVGAWVMNNDTEEDKREFIDYPERAQVLPYDYNDSGMSSSIPSLDSKEWKGGERGIKMWDVREGKGGKGDGCPEETYVTIHYTGWLKDGTEFETSRKGDASSYPLTSLIPGWQAGMQGMKVGGIRRLYIPYAAAYGESGSAKIPPKSDLVFEIKLLGFTR